MSSFTPDHVCTNPNCHSYGQAHPNCRCQPPEGYAEGGAVHFCSTKSSHHGSCLHFADGDEVQGNHEFINDPSLAIDHASSHNGLLHTLTKTGHTKSGDLLDGSRRGRKAIHSHAQSLLDPKSPRHDPNDERAQALEAKLSEFQSSPEKALEVGGNLGDTLPLHHAVLAAKAGTAMDYLSSIKPKPQQAGPLDKAVPPNHDEQRAYKRQLAIAENPGLFYQHVKDGTLIPQDLQTMNALFPKLKTHMVDKAFEALTNAKAQGKELTHKQKKHFAMILGEHLSFEDSPLAMQAIIKANAPMQPPAPIKKPKKATDVELRQINKVNELSETPLQRLQSARNR